MNAPSRFVAADEPWPPSKRADVLEIPAAQWIQMGHPVTRTVR
jgi:hypothetical protein